MNEFFDSLLNEEKDLVDTTTIQLQNAQPKHFIGLDCWCYEEKAPWIQAIRFDDIIHGLVWSSDRSIFCWLCLIDERDHNTPLHHTTAPIYTNEEFGHHVAYHHWPRSKYLSRLPGVHK